jgi:hypothetical protein
MAIVVDRFGVCLDLGFTTHSLLLGTLRGHVCWNIKDRVMQEGAHSVYLYPRATSFTNVKEYETLFVKLLL